MMGTHPFFCFGSPVSSPSGTRHQPRKELPWQFGLTRNSPPSRAGGETWLPELPLKSVSCRETELPPSEAEQDWAPCPEDAQREVTATEGSFGAEPVSVSICPR